MILHLSTAQRNETWQHLHPLFLPNGNTSHTVFSCILFHHQKAHFVHQYRIILNASPFVKPCFLIISKPTFFQHLSWLSPAPFLLYQYDQDSAYAVDQASPFFSHIPHSLQRYDLLQVSFLPPVVSWITHQLFGLHCYLILADVIQEN